MYVHLKHVVVVHADSRNGEVDSDVPLEMVEAAQRLQRLQRVQRQRVTVCVRVQRQQGRESRVQLVCR